MDKEEEDGPDWIAAVAISLTLGVLVWWAGAMLRLVVLVA